MMILSDPVDNDNDDQLGTFPPFMIIPCELAIKIEESLLARLIPPMIMSAQPKFIFQQKNPKCISTKATSDPYQ